jgi:hypothetical protein
MCNWELAQPHPVLSLVDSLYRTDKAKKGGQEKEQIPENKVL